MMKKPILYLSASLLFFFLVAFVLFRFSEKPFFYISGTLGASSKARQEEISRYPYLFFSIHREGDPAPFATSRRTLNHDFTRGPYPFSLEENHLFFLPLSKGKSFPDPFVLRVRLSYSDKISLENKEEEGVIRQELGPFHVGQGNVAILL